MVGSRYLKCRALFGYLNLTVLAGEGVERVALLELLFKRFIRSSNPGNFFDWEAEK